MKPTDELPENTIDLRDNLVLRVEADDEELAVIDFIEGEYPQKEPGIPVTDCVLCRDQDGKMILVSTGMDFETLTVEYL